MDFTGVFTNYFCSLLTTKCNFVWIVPEILILVANRIASLSFSDCNRCVNVVTCKTSPEEEEVGLY